MRVLLRPALWVALIVATASPAAHAAFLFPRSDSAARAKQQPGRTVHPVLQHSVRPRGNHLREVKPLGGTRPPAKTILAKRPP